MVTAADACAVAHADRRDRTAVDGDSSPLFFAIFIGAVRSAIIGIIRASDTGAASGAGRVDDAALNGNVAIDALF